MTYEIDQIRVPRDRGDLAPQPRRLVGVQDLGGVDVVLGVSADHRLHGLSIGHKASKYEYEQRRGARLPGPPFSSLVCRLLEVAGSGKAIPTDNM